MRSHVNERFRRAFAALPEAIQKKTREAYALWTQDPRHPSLRFKKIHDSLPIFSARIDRDWRAVGILKGSDMVWFWIGSHADYEKLIASLRKR